MPARTRRRPEMRGLAHADTLFDPGYFESLITRDVDPFPGAVVIARVSMANAGEEFGKRRPVVLIRDDGPWWDASCLTTRSLYGKGEPRTPAAGGELVGLTGNFVWGGLHRVHEADVSGVVWAAPREMLDACLSVARMFGPEYSGRYVDMLHGEHVAAGWYWPKPE